MLLHLLRMNDWAIELRPSSMDAIEPRISAIAITCLPIYANFGSWITILYEHALHTTAVTAPNAENSTQIWTFVWHGAGMNINVYRLQLQSFNVKYNKSGEHTHLDGLHKTIIY